MTIADLLNRQDVFAPRHLGPTEYEVASMLAELDLPSLDALIESTVPASIRIAQALATPPAAG